MPANEPFMPTCNISPSSKVETTWGVLEDYQRQIRERDNRIADLVIERDAMAAKLRSFEQKQHDT